MNAPPQRAAIHRKPCARVRSLRGSHVVNDLAMIGKQPASPTPKRNRITTIEVKFHAAPVSDGERRPGDDDPHQPLAGADPVAVPAAGDLEQAVAEQEGAQDRAHHDLVEAEIGRDERRCLRDHRAVDVGEDGQRHPEDRRRGGGRSGGGIVYSTSRAGTPS